MTPAEHFDALLNKHLADMRRRNKRPTSMCQRRRALMRLIEWTGDPNPLNVTTAQLESFLDRPLTPGALATEISHLQQFFKWAMRTGQLAENPIEPFGRPRVPRCLPRPIADDKLQTALEGAPDRIRPWLYLAAYAGLRATEIAQVRAEAVAFDTDPPLLIVEVSKGGGMSSLPMAPKLVEVLQESDLPTSGYLFRRHDGKPGPNAPWLVSQRSNEYLHSVGIPDTLHSLRHWFGTNSYRASGRDLRLTQELMRHQSPITTAQYTYVDPKEAVATVNALPVFEAF